LVIDGAPMTVVGEGNGPIDAFVRALRAGIGATLDVVDYAEHAIGQGSEAAAVAYVETSSPGHGVLWGVGTDPNIITASLRAVLNAHERAQR
jgi:2-isopropylmalate synthase